MTLTNIYCFTALLLLTSTLANAQLSIQSFTPLHVKTGDTVTITGNDFSPVPDSNFVSFNHLNAQVVSASLTQLKAIVPSGTSAGHIIVSKSGFSTVSKQVFYPNVLSGNFPLTDKNVTLGRERIFNGRVNYVQAADMDGDGMTDVIASIDNPGRIVIERNASTSDSIIFSDSLFLFLDTNPFIIRIADLNGDGKPDIVCISSRSNIIRIFRNNSTPGNLAFTEQQAISMNGSTNDIVIADFDNDGKQDIATGSENNFSNLEFFRNNSTESLCSFSKVSYSSPAIPTMNYLSSADYDNDGRNDIVAGSGGTNALYILRNTSSGPGNFSFKATTMNVGLSAGTEAGSTDLNQDGKVDIVISSGWYFPMVFLNTTTDTSIQFQQMYYSGNTYGQGYVSFTDLNGDGDPELLVGASFPVQSPGVYENLFPDSPLFNSSLLNIPLFLNAVGADFNQDGKTDLLGSGSFWNRYQVFINKSVPMLISSFSPQRATIGTTVTIKGLGFTGTTTVSFGNVAATSLQVINDSIITAVVGNAASGDIIVSAIDKTASLGGFSYFTQPLLQSFSPTSGYPGSEVLINGSNMHEVRQVRFGGVRADTFFLISNSQVKAIIGKGASGEVTIAGSDWDSSKLGEFTFFPAPEITGINSLKIPPGGDIVITGNYFNPLQMLTIGGIQIVPTSATPTSIRFKAPTQFIGGSITVKTPYGTDSLYGFYNGMHITSALPLAGKPGDTLLIMGNGFGNNLNNMIATIGTVNAKVLNCTPEMVTLKIPSGPAKGTISLTLNGHTVSAPNPFVFSFETRDSTFDQYSMQSFFPMNVFETDNPHPFTIADIDQDGKQDLIQKGHDKIIIYRNTGQPARFSFEKIIVSAPGIILNGKAIAKDLNMDGKPDLIFNSFSLDEVVHFINRSSPGNIAFESYKKQQFNMLSYDLLLHDFDKDGRIDYLINASSYNVPAIFLNRSTPDNITHSNKWDYFLNEVNVTSTQIVDLDLDGMDEVIIQQNSPNYNQPSFTIHTTPGKIIGKTKLTEEPSGCHNIPFLFADFNNDGKTDWLDFCTGFGFTIKKNTSTPGNISFSKSQFNTGLYFWKLGVIADFNGDARPDFVALDATQKTLQVFINSSVNNGDITFLQPFELKLFDYPDGMEGVYQIDVADLDGDNRPDIIIYGLQLGKVQIFRNLVGNNIPIFVCKDQPATFTAQSTGSSYQWQQSINGNPFTNLSNQNGFSGTQSSIVNMATVDQSLNGSLFRCVVDGVNEVPFAIRLFNKWIGTNNKLWSNAGNWSCGTIPQGDIEVEIDGEVEIDIDVTIGKIIIKPGGSISVATGKKLTVLH